MKCRTLALVFLIAAGLGLGLIWTLKKSKSPTRVSAGAPPPFLGNGFVNRANVCYQNAVMQNLLHSRAMTKAIDSIQRPSPNPIANDLKRIFELYSEQIPGRLLTTADLRASLSSRLGRYNNERPEDSAEFFTDLFTEIRDTSLAGVARVDQLRCLSCLERPSQFEYLIVVQNNGRQRLQQLMENHATSCPNCPANELTVYRKYPDLLVIQPQYGNAEASLRYPRELVLKRGRPDEQRFRLIGTVKHIRGHYVADILTDQGWIRFDDSKIKSSTATDRPQLLFYDSV